MKTHLCIPRLQRGNPTTSTTKNHRLSPATTLLERFREAVFRLIMISLSKSTGSSSTTTRSFPADHADHHSEAVADCIEFIKKKSAMEENHNFQY
ncbi:hypothetical protein HS088_TW01G00955 [Tripterygium wilfordii]|uniref:Uncharacterized protein n=1 Tax=Tripterygium wilfordii TaxID=458696 RepID=A0A7J7E368_TRIWF|nr:hypothetical protein HS088_TW01G00955 [Tripterygium wilfordii]